ncbi:MAG: beta-phosphoglucomutase [Maledivibacter sp.]|jgi:beta-phosphoglucomutase|nr:beta-phosphoglucomutase [Maledivibacter sp.]
MRIKGVIFDLDGVIVTTDNYHFEAWKRLADERDIYFDRKINEHLRGVSRMESLEIILKSADKEYSQNEKLEMTDIKNNYYKEFINKITPKDILPGVITILNGLKEKGIKIAIGSSSKNAAKIIKNIQLEKYFDAIVDGNNISKGKPDPEVFMKAARAIEVLPQNCLVVEDAEAGVKAAINGGMKVLGVGYAARLNQLDMRAVDLTTIKVDELINII